MTRDAGRAALLREIRLKTPATPGIYRFSDEGGNLLYVGKAINLRRRILGHFRPGSAGDESRHQRLLHAVRGFDFEALPSELLALLREDELIKQHRPPFNVRQNEFLEYQYLELTDDRYPRLRLLDHAPDFGARRVFGPYRDRYLAERVSALLCRHGGLRSCSEDEPGARCLEYDVGRCLGPCRGGAGASAYALAVTEAAAFLEGDVARVAARMETAMRVAAARLEFEKARELREQLAFCRRFGERTRFLRAFRQERLTVVEKGDPEMIHVFWRGRLRTGDGPDASGIRVEEPTGNDPRFVHDRGALVQGWLRRHADSCRYSFDGGSDSVGRSA